MGSEELRLKAETQAQTSVGMGLGLAATDRGGVHTEFAYVRTRARDRGRDCAELILPPRSQAARIVAQRAYLIFDFRMHIHIRVHMLTYAC